MVKHVVGALYGIFLEKPLDFLHDWKCRFEKEYLNYCRTGCKDCYKWNGHCRSLKEGTPYKKFRRKYGPGHKQKLINDLYTKYETIRGLESWGAGCGL